MSQREPFQVHYLPGQEPYTEALNSLVHDAAEADVNESEEEKYLLPRSEP